MRRDKNEIRYPYFIKNERQIPFWNDLWVPKRSYEVQSYCMACVQKWTSAFIAENNDVVEFEIIKWIIRQNYFVCIWKT